MQSAYDAAALAIFANDTAAFESLLTSNPGRARHQAERGHPTLLQMVACEEVHIADAAHIATLLMEAGAPAAAPLVAAAGCNGAVTLNAILEHGTDVDGESEWTPLDEAFYWNQRDVADVLIARGASQGRLRRAAAGDVATVRAFFNGQQTTAAELVKLGATVNATPPGYHWRGTALHAAIWRGNGELVRWLLQSGADPSLRDGLADADALGWAKHHERHSNEDLISLFVRD